MSPDALFLITNHFKVFCQIHDKIFVLLENWHNSPDILKELKKILKKCSFYMKNKILKIVSPHVTYNFYLKKLTHQQLTHLSPVKLLALVLLYEEN